MRRSNLKRTPFRKRAKPARRVMKDGREVLSGAAWTKRKMEVFARDGGRCTKCGRFLEFPQAHIHHVIRRGLGGGTRQDDMANLTTLCETHHQAEHEEERRPKLDGELMRLLTESF